MRREIEEDGSTISDDAVKQRGEIKVGITGNISQRSVPARQRGMAERE